MVLINKSLKNRIFYTAEGNLKFNIHGIADRQLSKHYEQEIVKGMHGFAIQKNANKKVAKPATKSSKKEPAKTTIITTNITTKSPDSKYLIQ